MAVNTRSELDMAANEREALLELNVGNEKGKQLTKELDPRW
jgi:hypothetical protein